ncbi:MAG: pyruvate dehydrogenase (acetyl-transferring) E1 component subunit alpha, partial [Actinomycetota bacterium]
AQGVADETFVATCEAEAETWVGEVRAGVISLGAPPVSDIFDHVFAEPPEALVRRRKEFLDGD